MFTNERNCSNESIYKNHNDNLILETQEECDTICLIYIILDFFHAYYIPSIILLGLVGNMLSCIVFLNTHLKLRSSSYYLAALATTDFGFLVSLFLVWLNYTYDWRVFNNDGWCEMVIYTSAVFCSLSSWLIVSFTVERFIAVQYPLHCSHLCTTTRAKIIILGLLILSLASHSYTFITAGMIQNSNGDEMCAMKLEYEKIMRIINIIDSIASLIVPLVLIVVMNTMIMRNLHKFGQRFNQEPGYTTNCLNRVKSDINLHQLPSGNSSHGGDINLDSLGSTRRLPSQQSYHSFKSHHSRNQSSRSPSTSRNVGQVNEIEAPCMLVSTSQNLGSTRYNQENITKMLVLISTVFILLNLPSYVIRLCAFFTWAKTETSTFWFLQQFFMLLYYTHFSINFLLYAMCGATFRRCLKQMLRRMLRRMLNSITQCLERDS